MRTLQGRLRQCCVPETLECYLVYDRGELMALILTFLSTGFGKIVAGILGAVFTGLVTGGVAYLRGRSSGKQSERNKQRAKDADSYEKSLQELAEAQRARNSVDPDSVPDADPYRRD